MSKNKSIEIYHKITKLPYSQCRRILKANHWDLTRALLPNFYKIVDTLREALQQVMKSLEPFAEAVIETFNVISDTVLNALDSQT
jgi:hypothetical protein